MQLSGTDEDGFLYRLNDVLTVLEIQGIALCANVLEFMFYFKLMNMRQYFQIQHAQRSVQLKKSLKIKPRVYIVNMSLIML